jgi:hypothetical protein
VGISYGGGHKVSHLPSAVRLVTSTKQELLNVKSSEQNTQALSKLCSSPSIMHIAGFQSNVFAAYAPRVYEFYSSNLNVLLNQSPFLRRNFQCSVFSAVTINFGPVTVTKPHTDPGNLSWGQCAITSLGEFDANLGGHLVLWDLGLVIHFPPSSTILIPSAILLHSNIKIQDGEKRYSVTQYTAGGLLRWVYNRFRSDKVLLGQMRKEEKAEEMEKWQSDCDSRFEEGLQMFSKIEDLIQ